MLDALAGAYETWDGRGWPAGRKGEEVPIQSRIAQLAEFAEVAHRVGGARAAASLRAGARQAVRPALADTLCRHAEEIFDGLDTTRPGTR